jgi:hypothetical protein
LAAEEGKTRAAELYQLSGGSFGRALALAQNDRSDPSGRSWVSERSRSDGGCSPTG